MPTVQLLNAVTTRDPDTVLSDHGPSGMLANEHADQLVDRMGWAHVDAEQQIKESHPQDGAPADAAPARSVRRGTARRASNRRATARSRQRDTEASIIEFLAQHPRSTAGDLAKGLNLAPGNVSTRLTKLAKGGEIKRASHGYSTNDVGRPRARERPLHRSH